MIGFLGRMGWGSKKLRGMNLDVPCNLAEPATY